jgi:hypothetical protein
LSPPYEWCIAVNDEKKYAQFFSIFGTEIVPTHIIRLLPDTEGGIELNEIDAEAAAFDARGGDPEAKEAFFYVIGSHGLSRSGKFQASRFFTIRFPVQKETGEPRFVPSDGAVSPEIKKTPALREVIKRSARLTDFAEKPLDANGVNVEGLAAKDGRLFVGFRAPVLNEMAYVLEVEADALFSGSVPEAITHEIALAGRGVRDLIAVSDGFLVLAGPVGDVGEFSIYHWTGTSEAAEHLYDLMAVADGNAEALLLLEESDRDYRVLILFDGIENGGPIERRVQRRESR